MPRQTEPNANNAMGSLLQGMLSRSRVRSENTQTISGHSGLRPDILITAPGCSPVAVEAEYMPAVNAEVEAKSRLGLEVAVKGRFIEAAIALRYPDEVGDADDLRALPSLPLTLRQMTRRQWGTGLTSWGKIPAITATLALPPGLRRWPIARLSQAAYWP